VSEGLASLTSAIERAVAPVASAASDLASAQARKKKKKRFFFLNGAGAGMSDDLSSDLNSISLGGILRS
jgi:hypothetical protein